MRDLIFRAWNKETKRMGSAFPLKVIVFDAIEHPEKPNRDWDNLTIMQFTGLRDINDKMIFEGDIVESVDWGQPKRARGIVIFEGYEWKVTPKKRGKHSTWYEIWSHVVREEGSSVEVIGNIYENPELLNTK